MLREEGRKEKEKKPVYSLIIIDGRLVLQRDAIISDSVVIVGVQSGIVGITSVLLYQYLIINILRFLFVDIYGQLLRQKEREIVNQGLKI